MDIFEVFEIETNLKLNGKKLIFNVLADNAVNAGHVASSLKFNGEGVNYSNIKSITPAFDGKVIGSYYYSRIDDLNPNYKPEPELKNDSNKDNDINLDSEDDE